MAPEDDKSPQKPVAYRRPADWKPKPADDKKLSSWQTNWQGYLITGAIFILSLILFPDHSHTARNNIKQQMPGNIVVVYGRDACGYTAAAREMLDKKDIPYSFRDVDQYDKEVRKLFPYIWRDPPSGGDHLPYIYYQGRLYIGDDAMDLVRDIRSRSSLEVSQ